MNLLEVIFDALNEPKGARERMQSMGVSRIVIDQVMALIQYGDVIRVIDEGRWSTISYRNDLD